MPFYTFNISIFLIRLTFIHLSKICRFSVNQYYISNLPLHILQAVGCKYRQEPVESLKV